MGDGTLAASRRRRERRTESSRTMTRASSRGSVSVDLRGSRSCFYFCMQVMMCSRGVSMLKSRFQRKSVSNLVAVSVVSFPCDAATIITKVLMMYRPCILTPSEEGQAYNTRAQCLKEEIISVHKLWARDKCCYPNKDESLAQNKNERAGRHNQSVIVHFSIKKKCNLS